jgi:hypothetical protein
MKDYGAPAPCGSPCNLLHGQADRPHETRRHTEEAVKKGESWARRAFRHGLCEVPPMKGKSKLYEIVART